MYIRHTTVTGERKSGSLLIINVKRKQMSENRTQTLSPLPPNPVSRYSWCTGSYEHKQMLQRNLFLLLNCSKHVSVFLALGMFWCAHKLYRHDLGLRSVGERYSSVTAGHLWSSGASLPAPGRLRAGQGSSALCNILGSFEAVRATPALLAPPPVAAGQSQRAWPRGRPREPRRGGEDVARRCQRREPAAASSPSTLGARPGETGPGRGGGSCGPAGTAAGGKLRARLLRLSDCSLALGKASYSVWSPTHFPVPPLRGRLHCVLLQGPARCQRRGETFAAGAGVLVGPGTSRSPLPLCRSPSALGSPPGRLQRPEKPLSQWGEGLGRARRAPRIETRASAVTAALLGCFFSRQFANYLQGA
ncbi:hypothetical protein H8958_015765 [Nasalis larvatus]